VSPESAVEDGSSHEREAILVQRRHGTVQVHRMFPPCHPVVVDLDIRTRVPTYEGPLRGLSLLDSLRKDRFPFFMPSPTAESGVNERPSAARFELLDFSFNVQGSKFNVSDRSTHFNLELLHIEP
jgi:hypothetical protein